LLNKMKYSFNDIGLDLSLSNNSYVSSIQNNRWFLPTFQFSLEIEDLFNSWNMVDLIISGSTSFDVNDAALFYNSESHNSLGINPSESLQYLATNDLFLNSTVALEEKENYEVGISSNYRISNARFHLGVSYFNVTTRNSVYPSIENNQFQLKNVADIVNQGIDAELKATLVHTDNFYYAQVFSFATNRTKVLSIANNPERFAIAGFSSTSKNLIVGESAGVIVGSAYERDENKNIIIDANGFPIAAEEAKIIGDPTPKFNLGFSNEIRWGDLEIRFVIDAQKGGDVWNGTQNVLNYFGTSQQSASERNITDFIFEGINQQGETNTIPVDFYNTENNINENKFVRNGFEGVAEDAIEDGSYINLKSINLTYKIIDNDEDKKKIKDLTFGLYGHNLFTWSKFKGASPYSGLYDTSNGAGLNFFNTPLISEVGFKINLKI